MADAVQAYIQATLRGTPCWIELPPEAVPSECRWDKYRRPVVPLRKALYGHPDAGTFWEQRCDESVRAVGFEPIGEEWPSVYIHEKLQLVPGCVCRRLQNGRAAEKPCPRVEHVAYTFED